jgi:hypothetical protein
MAALVLLACGSRNAAAITAQDVTEKMSHDQRFGYLTGLIDMTMYQTALSGNRTRAQCIYDAFYTKNAAQDDPWRRLNDALREFGDKRPESIVVLLIQKICGA